MGAPLLKSKMIAHEGDVKAGALSVNDAYDLTLYYMLDLIISYRVEQ